MALSPEADRSSRQQSARIVNRGLSFGKSLERIVHTQSLCTFITTSYGRVKSIISTDSFLNKSADVEPCQAQKSIFFPELSPATTSTG